MESMGIPGPDDAASVLAAAEAGRSRLAASLVLPSWFHSSIALAVAVQVAALSFGLADERPWAPGVLVGGLVFFAAVAGTQLARFRRHNGVWLGGLASRVVLGSATSASTAYVLAAGASVWAAFAGRWWVVASCAVAGGAAYAALGRRWWLTYEADPARHGRGEPAAWLVVAGALAVAGLVLLVTGR